MEEEERFLQQAREWEGSRYTATLFWHGDDLNNEVSVQRQLR